MIRLAFRAGYFTGWLFNRDGMPLDVSIADQTIIGSIVIVGLIAINIFL